VSCFIISFKCWQSYSYTKRLVFTPPSSKSWYHVVLELDISVSDRHDASVFRAIYNLSKLCRETPKTLPLWYTAALLWIRACCLYSAGRQNVCGWWIAEVVERISSDQFQITEPVFYLTSVLCVISPLALKLIKNKYFSTRGMKAIWVMESHIHSFYA
jgi:hypothetical protein